MTDIAKCSQLTSLIFGFKDYPRHVEALRNFHYLDKTCYSEQGCSIRSGQISVCEVEDNGTNKMHIPWGFLNLFAEIVSESYNFQFSSPNHIIFLVFLPGSIAR